MEKQKVNIEIKNNKEFKHLIEKAEKESVQLQRTTEQIQNFKFETEAKR